MCIEARAKEAIRAAQKVKDSGADWVQASNILNGLGGEFSKLFPTAEDRTAFIKTHESLRVREILESLPQPKKLPHGAKVDASGQIHARLPRTVHAALLAEAEAENVSLNQLIVAKLSAQLRAITFEPR